METPESNMTIELLDGEGKVLAKHECPIIEAKPCSLNFVFDSTTETAQRAVDFRQQVNAR